MFGFNHAKQMMDVLPRFANWALKKGPLTEIPQHFPCPGSSFHKMIDHDILQK